MSIADFDLYVGPMSIRQVPDDRFSTCLPQTLEDTVAILIKSKVLGPMNAHELIADSGIFGHLPLHDNTI